LATWNNTTDDRRTTQIRDANCRQAYKQDVPGIYTLRWGTYGSDTTANSPFLSLLHSPAFQRSSVINHLLKIQIRNRWAAVSTWPEANYSGMDSILKKISRIVLPLTHV
jgi:hypothetical protein